MDTTFDTSGWPLCRLLVGETPSSDDLELALSEFEDRLILERPFCVLANAAKTSRIELEHVKQIAGFGEKNHRMLAAHVRALAIVVPSAMVRGGLKVAFELKAPPHPYAIVATLEDAERFLEPFVRAIG